MASEPARASRPNFNEEARQAIGQALAASSRLHHNYVGSEHLLIGLCEVPSLRSAFDGWLSPSGARETVELIVGKPRRQSDTPPRLTPRARSVLLRAEQIAGGSDGPPVTARHILLALLELDDDAIATRVLGYANVDRVQLLAHLREAS